LLQPLFESIFSAIEVHEETSFNDAAVTRDHRRLARVHHRGTFSGTVEWQW
jgi:hypothetical protein